MTPQERARFIAAVHKERPCPADEMGGTLEKQGKNLSLLQQQAQQYVRGGHADGSVVLAAALTGDYCALIEVIVEAEKTKHQSERAEAAQAAAQEKEDARLQQEQELREQNEDEPVEEEGEGRILSKISRCSCRCGRQRNITRGCGHPPWR